MPLTPPLLWARPACLFALLTLEVLGASIAIDTQDLVDKGALAGWAGRWAADALRFGLALMGTLAVFSWPAWRAEAARFREEFANRAVENRWLAIHGLLALAATWAVAKALAAESLSTAPIWLAVGLMLAAGAAGAAVCGLIPVKVLTIAVRSAGVAWAIATLIAAGATFSGKAARALWEPSANLTYQIVGWLLRPFVPAVVADQSTLTIGTSSFAATIAPECSGYEGVGLVLAFSIGWLWFLRREYRFPAALILLPAAATAMWLLNSVRITALILVGHWGAPQVALGGFHSQAGWIAFLGVAIGLCVLSTRIPALAVTNASSAASAPLVMNEVAAYLMPFLMILAASIVSRAASGTFEWWYPARVIAAAAALWHFRRSYGRIDWRFGPWAIGIGAAVCALWIAFDASAPVGMNADLAASAWPQRWAWLVFRVMGAVVTVPIAEELAFRGFLMRRLSQVDFEAVSWKHFAWIPALMSSVAFGAMHGGRWLEGALAGLLYAWVMTRTGRLGDAIAAHAVTNALLAAWVLYTGQWQYW